jgi:hypothetical protein
MNIQLAPEIEAELRAGAVALGISIDSLIANAVKTYLRDGALPVAHTVSSLDRTAEMTWASHPDPHFVGKWVVLEDGHVVASGSDPKQLYEDVKEKGNSSPFLIFVSPDGQEPFAGGWID